LTLISRIIPDRLLLFFFERFGGIVGAIQSRNAVGVREAAMATRKKAKGKAKARRKKMPVSKGTRTKTIKKVRTTRKKVAKKTPLRPASRKQARPAKPKPRPGSGRAPKAVRPPPSRPAKPASSEQRIGVVTHYFSHLSVAVTQLEPGATLRVGDVIHIWGHTTDFTQKVESLEVDHAPVAEVGPKDDFGLKVIEHAREHDVVFKVRS
jgi:type IV secretory pathway VirB10-like protein